LIATRENRNNHIIHFHNLNTSGFSAFGYIFISDRLTPDESAEIIRHEQNHLVRGHSADVLLMETAVVLQWFNPFIYMLARSLRAIHEYQADNACLMTGIPVTSYQGLLLNQVFRSRAFTITNSFSNPSLIKKRMIMMTRKPSRPLANLKLILVLPVIVAFLFAFSSCKEKVTNAELTKQEITSTGAAAIDGSVKVEAVKPSPADAMAPPPPPPPPPSGDAGLNKGTTPYETVDVMPVFPGGDSEILKFIASNTVYPEKAKKSGIQGKVIVRFAVESDGSVDKISILKSVDPELDAEAVRVIGKLPKFTPGLVDDKPVPVWYMVPINFALK
jgi:TonB family protein